VLLLAGDVPGWLGGLLWILVGTSLGFLVYNWPPAKIFMGDVGSGTLGLLLAVIAFELSMSGMLPFIGCLILLTGFWFDASYTLCVRMISGQAFTEAHRSHLYQKVTIRIGHLWSTVSFLAFGVFWLLPLAALAVTFPDYQVLAQLVAILPMAIAAWRFRAGYPAPEDT
jgi:Fuc2NAc and GlcNAc transferase